MVFLLLLNTQYKSKFARGPGSHLLWSSLQRLVSAKVKCHRNHIVSSIFCPAKIANNPRIKVVLRDVSKNIYSMHSHNLRFGWSRVVVFFSGRLWASWWLTWETLLHVEETEENIREEKQKNRRRRINDGFLYVYMFLNWRRLLKVSVSCLDHVFKIYCKVILYISLRRNAQTTSLILPVCRMSIFNHVKLTMSAQ